MHLLGRVSKSLRLTGSVSLLLTTASEASLQLTSSFGIETRSFPASAVRSRETFLINAFFCYHLEKVALKDLPTAAVSAYRAERLRQVKPGTVNRESNILRHVLAVAHRCWDVPLASNPFADIVRPKNVAPRERRLQSGERECLKASCG
jgi:hypothetical protein